MNQDNRSFILAILLSIAVLIGWNAFIAGPRIQEEQERLKRQQQAENANKAPGTTTKQPAPAGSATPTPGVTPGQPPLPSGTESTAIPGAASTVTQTRNAAIKATDRIAIETPSLQGSINLTGGRIDDLTLSKYRETTEDGSPAITLFSPSGSPRPYYAEYGWVEPGKVSVGANTVWQAETQGPLTTQTPVTLKHDNGNGLVFRRTISVDDNYLFTVRQEVENNSGAPVTLYPYALISRHGEPTTAGIYILHEGMIGVFEKEGLQEIDYSDALD
ncbi:MAG: membrane protein insertase YidC, partial [Hyphomicrobiaceae bacterium]